MSNSLTWEKWFALSAMEQERFARGLVEQLPGGFRFDRLVRRERGAVAEFSFDGAMFALIPGGEVRVGYDSLRPWEPTEEEAENWGSSAEEFGIGHSIQEHLARVTRRPATVVVPTLLVETVATEVGWEPVPRDSDEAREVLKELKKHPAAHFEFSRGDTAFRVIRTPGGEPVIHRAPPTCHGDVVAQLSRDGFRLLTSDEWEYITGAGAQTLFRWGDHAPCDCYPIDKGSFSLHLEPNAFGVQATFDPYRCELVAEPYLTRGSDGGSMICGGTGFFLGWLPLATAYFEEWSCERDPEEPFTPGYAYRRRAMTLR